MSFALIRLFLGGALKSVIGWVGRFFAALNSQGWIGLVVGGLLAFLFIRAESESRHWHKQSDRYEKLYTADHSTLVGLRKQSKVQQVEVAKTVDHYITVEKPVIRKQVERIESAPLPGNCKTPQAVMEAGV